MKFTFPILTLCKGGVRVLVEIINYLHKRGHEIKVLMPKYGVVEYPIDYEVIRLDHAELHEDDYPEGDVIVSNFHTTVPSAHRASQKGKGLHIRFALCYESPVMPNNKSSYTSYHKTPNLLVLSQWQKQLMSLLYGIESRVVSVGIDPIFSDGNLRGRKGNLVLSAILRRPEGESFYRGQAYLLDQLEEVKALRPEVQIHFITPPNEFANSPILQKLEATGRYHFWMPKDDREVVQCYSQTDIFVAPSTYEAFGMTGLEAMSCGAALVATYAGGNMEYCKHEENCLLSYHHERRLQDDILRLIDDPHLRQSLASQGKKKARNFTWERSGRLFEEGVNFFWEEDEKAKKSTATTGKGSNRGEKERKICMGHFTVESIEGGEGEPSVSEERHNALEEELSLWRRRYEEILKSRSWRLTSPLRWIFCFFENLKREAKTFKCNLSCPKK